MINFFNDYPLHEIDSELFEALKERLFSDIAKPNSNIPHERWNIIPNFLSREEIDFIFFQLQNYLNTNENPTQLIQNIIDENYYLKEQNSQLFQQNENLIISNQNLNHQLEQMNQENHKLEVQLAINNQKKSKFKKAN
jgi:hypothetical protein